MTYEKVKRQGPKSHWLRRWSPHVCGSPHLDGRRARPSDGVLDATLL